jgi:hypothetical protein
MNTLSKNFAALTFTAALLAGITTAHTASNQVSTTKLLTTKPAPSACCKEIDGQVPLRRTA